MSTSEQNRIAHLRLADEANAEEGSVASRGLLPDVASLTQMANELFRALPGQMPVPAAAQP